MSELERDVELAARWVAEAFETNALVPGTTDEMQEIGTVRTTRALLLILTLLLNEAAAVDGCDIDDEAELMAHLALTQPGLDSSPRAQSIATVFEMVGELGLGHVDLRECAERIARDDLAIVESFLAATKGAARRAAERLGGTPAKTLRQLIVDLPEYALDEQFGTGPISGGN